MSADLDTIRIYAVMTEELKPCPFYKGANNYADAPCLGQRYWRIVCDDCNAQGLPGDSAEDAAKVWNERAS